MYWKTRRIDAGLYRGWTSGTGNRCAGWPARITALWAIQPRGSSSCLSPEHQIGRVSKVSRDCLTRYFVLYGMWHTCTAKTQHRKFETNIPLKELRGYSPNFCIHCFWSVCLFYCRKIGGRTWEYIDRSSDTWMWKLGMRPCNSLSGEKKYMNSNFFAVY
jgi:hypothetical protein